MVVRVGVIGATGYTGEELLDILVRHPNVRISSLAAKIDKPTPISAIFPKPSFSIFGISNPPTARAICGRVEEPASP